MNTIQNFRCDFYESNILQVRERTARADESGTYHNESAIGVVVCI
jgi:hypothetical protein